MRLSKFLFTALIVTALALSYVHQQTEIERLAYAGQTHMKKFQTLLDSNANLRYSFKQKTSLVYMGSKVAGQSDFTMPENYCVVRLAQSSTKPVKHNAMIARFFGIKRQAEARSVNPSLTFGLGAQ